MRVLVTGGAGFIGSAVVRRLVLERGADVLNFDKLTYAGSLSSLRSVAEKANYRFVEADICDGHAVATAFASFRPDCVIHLAAESHVDRSIDEAQAFVQTNVVGTFTLLDAAYRYWSALETEAQERFRFLHVSTDEVYGSIAAPGLFTEASAYDPSSPYAASKASSDHLARAWYRTHGLPVIISNSSNNYGGFQFPEKLIPATILKARVRQPLAVYGNGNNVRDWLHVEDHVSALEAIVARGKPGASYNVGAQNPLRNIDVVRAVCRHMDRRKPDAAPHEALIDFVADRPGHDARYASDTSLIRGALGWEPQVPFDRGLGATVDWYLDNEAWWATLQSRYQGQRLGLRDGQSKP